MATRYLVQGITIRDNPTVTTLANVQDIEAAFRSAFPNGKLNWAIDRTVLSSASGDYPAIRSFIAGKITSNGDQASLWLEGGFPAVSTGNPGGAGLTTTQIRANLDTNMANLAAAFPSQTPTATAWHLPADTVKYLNSQWGQKTAWGQVWSQTGIDGFTSGATVNCPFIPTLGNSQIPAQTTKSGIDCLVVDTISQELWSAQSNGSAGRFTVHPVDAVTLSRMQSITTECYNHPNDIQWVTSLVEMDWIYDASSTNGNVVSGGVLVAKQRFKDWLAWLPGTFPDTQPVTLKAFGDAWRAKYPNNSFDIVMEGLNYSDFGQGIAWRFTKNKRMAVARTATGLKLVDLARYADGLGEPAAPAADWSFTQQLSQKDSTKNLTNPYGLVRHIEIAPLLRRSTLLSGSI